MNKDVNNIVLVDYVDTQEIIKNMIQHIETNHISIVFVSERLFDVLDIFYYINSFVYIYDLNRKYYEYGYTKKINANSELKSFFE